MLSFLEFSKTIAMQLLPLNLFDTFIIFGDLFTDIVMDIKMVIRCGQVDQHCGLVVTL
jgi:hypothetical protein